MYCLPQLSDHFLSALCSLAADAMAARCLGAQNVPPGLTPHGSDPRGAGKMQVEEHLSGDRSPTLRRGLTPTCQVLDCRCHLVDTYCAPGTEAQGVNHVPRVTVRKGPQAFCGIHAGTQLLCRAVRLLLLGRPWGPTHPGLWELRTCRLTKAGPHCSGSWPVPSALEWLSVGVCPHRVRGAVSERVL